MDSHNKNQGGDATSNKQSSNDSSMDVQDTGFDPKFVEMIENEYADKDSKRGWKDIVGLGFAKTTVYEIIVWPILRPDIFNGLRSPPTGLLLFGPRGTGKTMLGKIIANESNSTLFSISASLLTSKLAEEGVQIVKALFAIAATKQPAVVMIDEIDCLFLKDNELTQKIKAEFLVQLDRIRIEGKERILTIGIANRPQELDQDVIKRFQKRLYIPLPESEERRELIKVIIEKDSAKGNKYDLSPEEIEKLVDLTKGYSGADMRGLCAEAAMVRLGNNNGISETSPDNLRAINFEDFISALKQIQATVSLQDLRECLHWNRSYGSFKFKEEDLED